MDDGNLRDKGKGCFYADDPNFIVIFFYIITCVGLADLTTKAYNIISSFSFVSKETTPFLYFFLFVMTIS